MIETLRTLESIADRWAPAELEPFVPGGGRLALERIGVEAQVADDGPRIVLSLVCDVATPLADVGAALAAAGWQVEITAADTGLRATHGERQLTAIREQDGIELTTQLPATFDRAEVAQWARRASLAPVGELLPGVRAALFGRTRYGRQLVRLRLDRAYDEDLGRFERVLKAEEFRDLDDGRWQRGVIWLDDTGGTIYIYMPSAPAVAGGIPR